jgi:hypothetical protein
LDEARPALLEVFSAELYGRTPRAEIPVRYEVLERDGSAFEGRAYRTQVRLHFGAETDGPRMDLLIFRPAHARRTGRGGVPAFLGLNFRGNAAVYPDPAIRLGAGWVPNDRETGATANRATEASRGVDAARWPVETIVGAGYALVTAAYGDLEPDEPARGRDSAGPGATGPARGVRSLFPSTGRADEWGAIGVWAWGLSRALDYLETDPAIDARRVAVVGHSRLGKTALWAAAQDPRFAMAISIQSGCLGAALSKRRFGETIGRITRAFPHWFAPAARRYAEDEDALPVDQHQLLALLAPRPLYVASASQDAWADPHGEFLAAQGASPVWGLFGRRGLGGVAPPAVDQPVRRGLVGYHVRHGTHDVTAYDWAQFLAFADLHLRAP